MIEDYLRSIRGHYYKLPTVIQSFVGSAYAMLPQHIRLGGSYEGFRNILRETEFKRDGFEEFQFEELKKTLTVAHENIPFYQRKFAEYGVTPASLQRLEDIKKFPTMTKKDLKDHYHDLINPNVPASSHLVTTTGGSTAEPARFLHMKGVTRTKERAFIFDGWSRGGYYPRAKTVQLKGRTVGNPEKKIFWQYEAIQNFLEMDSNYLTLENIPYYVEAILQFKPEFMIGYASSVYLLAKHMNESGMTPPKLRCIYLASENVYEWQREYLESYFKCQIFSHYGHSEMLLLGMECEYSHELHFYPQYGLLELLADDGTAVPPTSGGVGELVGTSFHNELMPLIRYKTQDLGRWGNQNCRCGRNYPILEEVEGRLQEFIVTRDHRFISICVMGAAHFDVLDYVYETQYYQDKPGELVFKIVPKQGFNDQHKQALLKAVQDKTGGDVSVSVELVDRIKRTKNGKHLMIEQKLDLHVLTGDQDLILADEKL